tara:strand:+ start:25 stop:1146 length:1122 start_codon:yes stop_codon:yes gene_type:complete
MENQEIHIGIVGAGRIGTAIYSLLVGKGSDYKVSIADIDSHQAHNPINESHYIKIDTPVSYETQFDEFVKDKTLIINALPFTQNIYLYQACLEYEVPYFDLSEDDALDKWIEHRSYISPTRTGIPFTMPHCGLAPGISTVVANHLAKDFSDLHDVKIRVGALSQDATNKLKYHGSWSGDGLVNEYMGKCQVVRNGSYDEVDALSGYETLTIDCIDYEAFHTSGGIGTFAKTLDDRGIAGVDVDYKTVRRIGHHQYADFLFNDLKLPQDILTDLFKKYIPTTRKDEVILYAAASGHTSNELHHQTKTYSMLFRPQSIYGRRYTAIEYTTACGMLAMVELFLVDKLPKEGYVTQESVSWEDVLGTTFGRFYREDC